MLKSPTDVAFNAMFVLSMVISGYARDAKQLFQERTISDTIVEHAIIKQLVRYPSLQVFSVGWVKEKSNVAVNSTTSITSTTSRYLCKDKYKAG
jgi:hypothetical protein